jgi:hypothetical protein
MTTISIGQEQLVNRRSFFLSNEKAHIVGRFMPSEYRFRGIQQASEMEYVLQSYDESEFPVNSGWYFIIFQKHSILGGDSPNLQISCSIFISAIRKNTKKMSMITMTQRMIWAFNEPGFASPCFDRGQPMNNHFEAEAATKERAFLRKFGKEGYTFYTVKEHRPMSFRR